MNSSKRYSRQKELIPPERLAVCPATVIGVGAIGRQVALQLASIGIKDLQLIDFDEVEESNVASQGYCEHDIGQLKVNATAAACRRINAELRIDTIKTRFRRSMSLGDAIFCCVDSIDTRRLIWEATKDRTRFFTDGRMNAEVIRVLSASDPLSREHYPTTLFAAGEAHAGSCTAKSTIYTANIAAGLMLGRFTQWLRGLPEEPDIMLNLLTSEIAVASS